MYIHSRSLENRVKVVAMHFECEKVKCIIRDAIQQFFQNETQNTKTFSIDAMIGVTVEEGGMFYMTLNEVIPADKVIIPRKTSKTNTSVVSEWQKKRGRPPKRRRSNQSLADDDIPHNDSVTCKSEDTFGEGEDEQNVDSVRNRVKHSGDYDIIVKQEIADDSFECDNGLVTMAASDLLNVHSGVEAIEEVSVPMAEESKPTASQDHHGHPRQQPSTSGIQPQGSDPQTSSPTSPEENQPRAATRYLQSIQGTRILTMPLASSIDLTLHGRSIKNPSEKRKSSTKLLLDKSKVVSEATTLGIRPASRRYNIPPWTNHYWMIKYKERLQQHNQILTNAKRGPRHVVDGSQDMNFKK